MYKRTIGTQIFMTVVMSLSTSTQNWKSSLQLCKNVGYRPSTINDTVDANAWIGEAIYQAKCNISLKIEEEEGKRTCIAKDGDCTHIEECQFCDISNLRFNLSIAMMQTLTPNRKYIVADFRNIEEIFEPQLCLVNTANFIKRYVVCNQEYEDGCKATENISKFKITLNITDSCFKETRDYYLENGIKRLRGSQLQLSGLLMFNFLFWFYDTFIRSFG